MHFLAPAPPPPFQNELEATIERTVRESCQPAAFNVVKDTLMFRNIRCPKWERSAAPEIVIRFAFSDGTKSFGVALSNLGVAPKVGVAGVAPEVGEKAPLCTPLCTLLSSINSGKLKKKHP